MKKKILISVMAAAVLASVPLAQYDASWLGKVIEQTIGNGESREESKGENKLIHGVTVVNGKMVRNKNAPMNQVTETDPDRTPYDPMSGKGSVLPGGSNKPVAIKQITGRIVDQSGNPIQGARVIIGASMDVKVTGNGSDGNVYTPVNRSKGDKTYGYYTDADGRFTLNALNTGSYEMFIFQEDYEPLLMEDISSPYGLGDVALKKDSANYREKGLKSPICNGIDEWQSPSKPK